ncbi:hypothetical protein GCM10009122_28480 [Fulvivirga kasyanovii]
MNVTNNYYDATPRPCAGVPKLIAQTAIAIEAAEKERLKKLNENIPTAGSAETGK